MSSIKKLDFSKYNDIKLAKQVEFIATDIQETINAIIDTLEKQGILKP